MVRPEELSTPASSPSSQVYMLRLEEQSTPASSPARTWSHPGAGKGGKRFMIAHNSLKKVEYTAEEKKKQWEKWKFFLNIIQNESELLLDDDPTASHVSCPDCSRPISRGNFVWHRTLQGCAHLKPQVKLHYWLWFNLIYGTIYLITSSCRHCVILSA